MENDYYKYRFERVLKKKVEIRWMSYMYMRKYFEFENKKMDGLTNIYQEVIFIRIQIIILIFYLYLYYVKE